MRIPLDYYRILSVPIQAVDRQLEQAYSDRLQQQPRREFNDHAIEARQALIRKAYEVLSDSEKRAEYDAQFLVNMQPIELLEVTEESQEQSAESEAELKGDRVVSEGISSTSESADVERTIINSAIEIPSSQLVGALLIMQELGEYELVLTQGIEYYNSEEFSQFQKQNSAEVNIATQENIILAIALAYMELGREQWHRREYETAALSSQLGIDLLAQENLFPQVKQELEIDLYKLRPYRVLELISQNPANSAPRVKGFHLLQEMLIQRRGIEGKGEDRSGLSFDQFLCFIQQLRTYLTSTEQKQLFDDDTQNDSAIGSYLAVYALFGLGFTGKQPELILRAQRKLDYLSEKQDVTWEQAVCALLLGHTEKAISKVHQTQDTTKLNQILQHAPGSADLLPGMCFYSEKWLHEDVLAQFVDLVNTKPTLKGYFADSEVQTYLDQLAPSTVLVTAETASVESTPSQSDILESETNKGGIGVLSRWRSIFNEKASSNTVVSANQVIQNSPRKSKSSTATIEKNAGSAVNRPQGRVKARKGREKYIKPKAGQEQSSYHTHQNKRRANAQHHSISLPLEKKTRAVPASVIYKAQGQAKQKRMAGMKKANRTKSWLLISSFIFGLGAIGLAGNKLFFGSSQQTAKAQLAIAIDDPTVELPPVKAKSVVAKPELTIEQKSLKTIEKWLTSKSAAFGKEHQMAKLDGILAEPLLTTWRDRAVAYKEGNYYREYQHQVKMRSAKVNPNNPKKAVVEAEVKEVAKHYQAGQLDTSQSYDDNLLVRYQLILQGDKWLIQNAEVLETL
ncbi:MAG: IMS domain-containing protein [Cyanobacteria bacterium P01_G01_bin.19]